MKLKGLEQYDGSKGGSGVYQTIINHMPPHNIYIELCLGKGEILLHKKPALFNYGVDIDRKVCTAWFHNEKQIVKKKGFEHLSILKRSLFDFLSDNILALYDNRFRAWFKDRVPDPKEVLIYIDPPYPFGSRKGGTRKIYRHEMSDDDHVLLLGMISARKEKIIISTYPNPIYKRYLLKKNGWNFTDFRTQTRKGPAIERIYYNFEKPTELHDYRYVGSNYRQRERIKNKIKRRVAGLIRLQKKNPVEFNAVMRAVEEQISQHQKK
jgi:DNA adenine methylase